MMSEYRYFIWPLICLLYFVSFALSNGNAGENEISRRSVVVRVAEASSPAVVNISTETTRDRRTNPFYQFRGGKRLHLNIRGGDFPPEYGLRLARSVLGIEVTDIDDGMIRKYNLYARHGVVVTAVDGRKVLGRIGVQPGDVIHQIGDRAIASLDDYKKAISVIEMRKNVLFQIQRGPWANYVTVDIWGDQG